MKQLCLGHTCHLDTQKTIALFNFFSDTNQICLKTFSYLHDDGSYRPPQLTKEYESLGFSSLS